jgi:hypothetical protein
VEHATIFSIAFLLIPLLVTGSVYSCSSLNRRGRDRGPLFNGENRPAGNNNSMGDMNIMEGVIGCFFPVLF